MDREDVACICVTLHERERTKYVSLIRHTLKLVLEPLRTSHQFRLAITPDPSDSRCLSCIAVVGVPASNFQLANIRA